MDNKTKAHILGETLAKLYFELQNYYVYTNSSGKAEFDLVLSKEGMLYSVEVKTVSSKKESSKGYFFDVQLKSVRSNTVKNVIYNFDSTYIDYLVIVDITTNKIVVLEGSSVKAQSSLRIYEEEFKIVDTLAESA